MLLRLLDSSNPELFFNFIIRLDQDVHLCSGKTFLHYIIVKLDRFDIFSL